MSVTMQDIAQELKISKATVSRVLNNSGGSFYCSEETRRRVMEKAKELGYKPNHTARSLATGKTNLIALWSPGIQTATFAQLAYSLQNLVRRDGFGIITGEFGRHTPKAEGGAVLARWTVDGIVVAGGRWWLEPFLKQNNISTPLVHINATDNGSLDVVHLDLYPASCEILRLLIGDSRSRIAHMSTAVPRDSGDGRSDAYRTILHEAGMEEEYIDLPDGSLETAYKVVKEYVQAHGYPDAIFCSNDDIAIGVSKGLKELGIKIPDDVAIVGCDGIKYAEYLETAITTIARPVDEISETAWKFLKNRMEDPSIPRQYAAIPSKLILRESTGLKL
jgi:DNA-binding LacI/PurR family transcriptional regulator